MTSLVEVVERPWGVLKTLKSTDGYLVKEITVPPGKQCSLHVHQKRDEHWIVVSGDGQAVVGGEIIEIRPNMHVHLPAGLPHRVINSGLLPLCYIEVVYGGLDEEDLQKLECTYDV